MKDIKKIVAIIAIAVIALGAIVALVTGNFYLGKQVESKELIDAIKATYNSDEMEYNYTFQGRIAYKVAGIFGPWADAETIGNVKWNNDDQLDSNFIVFRESSGLLLFDTQEFIYNIGDTVFTEKVDDDMNLSFKTSEGGFDSTYTFETDMFGDVIRNIEEDDISSVTYFEELGVYNVKFSDSISGAFANQMSSLAQTAFSEDGSSNHISLSMDCEITLKDGYVDTFEFSISLEITDIELSFEFQQQFISFEDVVIEIPVHENVLTGDQLDTEVENIQNLFMTFFSSAYSNYSFDYRNQIDAGVFSWSLGTDFRGTHKVLEVGGINYFNNYFELDSDYKPDLPDQKQSIALINDEDRECWKEIFNIGINDYELVTDYDSVYETQFTFLDYASLLNNIEFVVIEEDDQNTIYRLGVSGESALIFFDLLNESISYSAYQYSRDLQIGAFEIKVVVNNDNLIEEINVFIEGKYIDVNETNQNYTIKLDYESSGVSVDEYKIPVSKEDVN